MPIRLGGKTGRKYYYRSETGEVTSSSDPNIPAGSNVYDDGIIRDQRPPDNRPTDDSANRVRKIMNKLIGLEDSEDLMLEIMEALQNTVTPVPTEGKYYTFVYTAKTPNIVYDQHPLIACTEVYATGFTGINFHWGKYRKYTWQEIAGMLYEVDAGELADLREISYAKFLNS